MFYLKFLFGCHGHHMTCALIRTSRKLAAYTYTSSLALWTTFEYELVDANGGIQKVRVEPATRSTVATWYLTCLLSQCY